jgi:hypothetical protein
MPVNYLQYSVVHQTQQFHLFFYCFRFTLIQLIMKNILFYVRVAIHDNNEKWMWILWLESQQLSLIYTDLEDFLGLLTTVKTSENLEVVEFSAFFRMFSQKLAKGDLECQLFIEYLVPMWFKRCFFQWSNQRLELLFSLSIELTK